MSQDRVLATYLIETPHSLEHAAAVIAGEQSSGTFVSVPGETSELKERFGAQVVRIDALDTVSAPSLPGSKAPRSDAGRTVYQRGRVVISFPLHNFGPSLPSLLATVAGNLYELQELSGIRLEDLELPQAFAQRYPGPGFGIDGTRKLAQVSGRPLIGTIIKPSIGLSTEALCKLVRDLASAGLDFIKDDELQADPPYAPLAQRIAGAMREIERVADATGRKAMYAFNITGDVDHMLHGHDLREEARRHVRDDQRQQRRLRGAGPRAAPLRAPDPWPPRKLRRDVAPPAAGHRFHRISEAVQAGRRGPSARGRLQQQVLRDQR